MNRHAQCGYVALEFVLAMGLLVMPTAIIVLQIPTYLEQKDRANVVVAQVAFACASRANSMDEGNTLAQRVAQEEMQASSVLRNARLDAATCTYTAGSLRRGSIVRASISIEVSAPILPGMPSGAAWTIQSSHDAVIPRYRSIEK